MLLLHMEADHIIALMTEQVDSQNYIFDRTVPVTGTSFIIVIWTQFGSLGHQKHLFRNDCEC